MGLKRASKPAPTLPIYVAEPSARYLARLPLVVDCSLLAAVVFSEPERPLAEARIANRTLHAPRLLDHEMTQVALTKRRRGYAAAELLESLDDYKAQDLQLHDTDPLGQFALGQRYGLSAYDAAYLWLAAQLRAPLATFDRRLAEAAQAHLSQL